MQRAGAPPRADRSARPLGLPRSLAANLNPGPQFCSLDPRWRGPTWPWPQLAAHSSQLGCGHAAHSNPCTLPSLPRSPQFCSKQQAAAAGPGKKKHKSTRAQEGALRGYTTDPQSSFHTSNLTSHTSIRTYIVHITRTKAARATNPCGHSNPTKNSGGIAQRADEADSSGQPAASAHCPIAHTAAQSRAQFPGIRFLAHHPGFGFWLFKVGFAFDFDCRPRSSRVQWQTASSPAVTTPLLIARALALQSHPTRSGFV